MDLHRALQRETDKRIARHQARLRRDAGSRRGFARETGELPLRRPTRPALWGLLPPFDPYRVRARLETVAHGVARSIREEHYVILPAVAVPRLKRDGSTRTTYQLSIPDAAVSYAFAAALEELYGDAFHPSVFGFRRELGMAAALRHVTPALRSGDFRWAVCADFVAFFASLKHEPFLRSARDRLGIAGRHMRLIETFLKMPRAASVERPRARGDDGGRAGARRGVYPLYVSLACGNAQPRPSTRRRSPAGVGRLRR